MAVHIQIASEAGACYGVERALRMVEDAAKTSPVPVHTLGPLIHNPRVVADLALKGVTVVDSPEESAGDTLLLRTHGVTPNEERQARKLCHDVLDATCPFVKKVHLAASRLYREGYQVVVVGEAGHPEVEATLPHAPGAVVVVDASEVADLPACKKIGVVVQTTQSRSNLERVVSALLGKAEEVCVVNTICDATSGHQGACAELAARADVMIVIGGKISANTKRLAEIAAELCPRTYHIEGADELDPSWLDGAVLIGITAGASTPASQIDAVRLAIEAAI